MGWPGTIPPVRMQALIKTTETRRDPGGEQILADMEMLIRAEKCFEISTTPPELPQTTNKAPLTGKALSLLNLEELTQVAWQQDTAFTIGGILSRVDSDPEKEERIIFKLLRDPEWMGYNPILPWMKGLNVTISESREMPGSPGIASAEPAEDGFPPGTTPMFPIGEGKLLASIMKWHEANEVRWRPQSEQTGYQSWYNRQPRQ